MTVFYPDGWKPTDSRPGIVFFFGGGFVNGSTRQFYSKAGDLASRGMVAASAEYRVKSKCNTTKEDALVDCQAAFAWLQAHAREQGIDPAKLSAGGGSAGGSCAMSLFATGAKPASMVLFNPGGLAQAEPVAGMPPTILFFGSADKMYPEAQAYWRKAQASRLPVQLFVAKDQPHGFFNDRGDGTWHASTTYLADGFLRSQGFLQGKPTIAMPQGSMGALCSRLPPRRNGRSPMAWNRI